MEDGALGLASALIYVPDGFNRTEELTAMAHPAAEYDALYIHTGAVKEIGSNRW